MGPYSLTLNTWSLKFFDSFNWVLICFNLSNMGCLFYVNALIDSNSCFISIPCDCLSIEVMPWPFYYFGEWISNFVSLGHNSREVHSTPFFESYLTLCAPMWLYVLNCMPFEYFFNYFIHFSIRFICFNFFYLFYLTFFHL